MSKQSVTISIESETWHAFQKHCIDNSTKPSRLVQNFMETIIVQRTKRRTKNLSAQQEARLLLRKLTSGELAQSAREKED